MRTRTVALLASLALSAGCVDPSAVSVFGCDGGDCQPSSGGGAAQAGGGAGQAGGGAGQGGGATACDDTTCGGCCDGAACLAGDTAAQCGSQGAQCVDCGEGVRCLGGACVPLLGDGEACGDDDACASGFCVAGACCSARCDGPCEACDGAGVCRPAVAGSAATACGAYACDGLGGACPGTCTSQQQCAPGFFCDGAGACVPLRPDGEACAANLQCASGFCADGVCCEGACTGSCDRCNLPGEAGRCRPASAGDPGSPACGGGLACNGTLTDCPIPCGNGCPTGTWCNGQHCAAKKPQGAACGGTGECASGFCVDGVCCDGACAGACQACAAAFGATADGACTLLGPSTVCRQANGACDVEERCTGTQAGCPADAKAPAGTNCGQTTYTAWGACAASGLCSSSGTQTRTRDERQCAASGACQTVPTEESRSCQASPNATCGPVTHGAWSACGYGNNACATTGTRTRTVTTPTCSGGTCAPQATTETDTQGCVRQTDGDTCGPISAGSWSTCSYGNVCATTGTRTRTLTTPTCNGGSCGTQTTTQTDTAGCARNTDGAACGTVTYGPWSTCSYGNLCATTGTRTRTVTTPTCGNGGCTSQTTTQTDTQGCTRQTNGVMCGPPSVGQWSACDYGGSTCAISGTRTRNRTDQVCVSGTCFGQPTTETDTQGCARDTDGINCNTAPNDQCTACGCSPPSCGSPTRSCTGKHCSTGACVSYNYVDPCPPCPGCQQQ